MTDEYIVLTEDRNITYSVFVLQKTAVIFISQPFFYMHRKGTDT